MANLRIVAVAARAPEAVPAMVAVPILAADSDRDDAGGTCPLTADELTQALGSGGRAVAAEIESWLAYDPHDGKAGHVVRLTRPQGDPLVVLLVGVGPADEGGWRAAGAALARTTVRDTSLTVAMNLQLSAGAAFGLATGLRLARYRFRLAAPKPVAGAELAEVRLAVANPPAVAAELETADAIADATAFARDLTNTPSDIKSPQWFADQVRGRAEPIAGLSVRIRDEHELAEGGFGGIVAVGRGSVQPPRLVELSWRPERAERHVVLVGKGITFDTGGISIKPAEAMLLMRKDMGGAAAVVGATLAAAALKLPIRITTLAPLAENAFSGAAMRPGDVITHYDGQTSEVTNTDAEGRLVLADALGYAAATLAPDYLIDLATLTGANLVALGRQAALYSDDDRLAQSLADAATAAGERAWRMPLYDDYLADFASDVADRTNSAERGAGSVTAALYLREFTGTARERWAHFDMSAPSWTDKADAELTKGATGWGVRTLVRWLQTLPMVADPTAETVAV